LVIFFDMQYGHSFSCSISNSSLECPPQGGNLYHLADTMDTIGRRLLIDDHPHVSEIDIPTKQPWGFDEKRGLSIT
jgi:hypothetical protein